MCCILAFFLISVSNTKMPIQNFSSFLFLRREWSFEWAYCFCWIREIYWFLFFLSWKERRNLLNSDYFRRSKKFICCKKTSIWISDFTGFPVYLWLWIALEELNRLKMLKIQLTFTQILILIDILVVCNKKKV